MSLWGRGGGFTSPAVCPPNLLYNVIKTTAFKVHEDGSRKTYSRPTCCLKEGVGSRRAASRRCVNRITFCAPQSIVVAGWVGGGGKGVGFGLTF